MLETAGGTFTHAQDGKTWRTQCRSWLSEASQILASLESSLLQSMLSLASKLEVMFFQEVVVMDKLVPKKLYSL